MWQYARADDKIYEKIGFCFGKGGYSIGKH
jgi:hypothetical protein